MSAVFTIRAVSRYLLLFLALSIGASFTTSASTQPPEESGDPALGEWLIGYWEGAYVRANSVLRVNMRFSRNEDGKLEVYREFPNWLFYGPLGPDPVELDDRGRIVLPQARYGEASLQPDRRYDEMIGQSGSGTPGAFLHLKRGVPPPPPVAERRGVSFVSEGFELDGELYLPPGDGLHPGIVLNNGGPGCSQKYQRARIADKLAEYGLAALAFDQRGAGDSEGDCADVSFETLSSDALAAYRWLGGREKVDAERVGFWGSSAGSWWSQGAIEKILDNGSIPEPAFMIGWVGMGTSTHDVQRAVKIWMAEREGLSDSELADVLRVIDVAGSSEMSNKAIYEELQAIRKRAERDGWLGEMYSIKVWPENPEDVPTLWHQRFDFDPARVLRRMGDIPYLAVLGEDDPLVPYEDNAPRMRRLLAEAGNEQARIVGVPGVGHNREVGDRFRELDGSVMYYKFDRVAPDFFGEMIRFLEGLEIIE
jgi:pimeloyl-ACP methyl ester carboxylesterase